MISYARTTFTGVNATEPRVLDGEILVCMYENSDVELSKGISMGESSSLDQRFVKVEKMLCKSCPGGIG